MDKTSIVLNDAVRNTPTTGSRVYCLYRVSTNQQVDHDEKDEADIPMQRLECHKFAERMGWTIIHEEQEEGVSGHKVRAENRDKIQLIKDAARQKKFDIFLVFMFDRIGRIADETPRPVPSQDDHRAEGAEEVWQRNPQRCPQVFPRRAA